MICRNCNKMIPDGRNFCLYCGSRITYSQNPEEGRQNSILSEGERKSVADSREPVEYSRKSVAERQRSNISEQKSNTNEHETFVWKEEQTSDKFGNSSYNQESKKNTKYVAIISVLATLACCMLFFIIYQMVKKPTPIIDTNTLAEDKNTEEEDANTAVIDKNPVADDPTGNYEAAGNNEKSNNVEASQYSIPSNVDIPIGAVTFQGHSYYIFDGNSKTWEMAHTYCKSRGGYMAVIESELEDVFLFNYMIDSGRNEVYFGLSDAESEGNWKWVDNKSSSYNNWGVNDDGEIEPNKDAKDENYAEFDASLISGRWNDCGFGRDTSAYICEWDYVISR